MDSSATGILLSQMECPVSLEADFHKWYNDEHIPERMAVPGFLSAARYEVVGKGPRFLARYNLKDLSALDHPDYVKVKKHQSEETEKILSSVSVFTRYLATVCSVRRREGVSEQPGDSPYIVIDAFNVPEEVREDLVNWYEQELADNLLRVEGWWRCLRLSVVSGEPEPWTDIIIHELASLEALEAPERLESWKTSWAQRLRSQSCFQTSQTILYKKFLDW